MNLKLFTATFLTSVCMAASYAGPAAALDYEDYPIVKLRTLDKITARTMTFEAKVGATMKFGEIFIKVQTCRKPPPVQKTEASAFLQIWETDTVKDQSRWVFSGWMFGSSPTLSAMDHPVYDVWVIDCLGKDPEALPPPEEETAGEENDGVLPDGTQPDEPPPEQLGNETPRDPATSGTIDLPAEQSPPQQERQTRDDLIEEESVPASNLPQDAERVPQQDAVPDDAVAPVAPASPAAPASGGGTEGFQGIY